MFALISVCDREISLACYPTEKEAFNEMISEICQCQVGKEDEKNIQNLLLHNIDTYETEDLYISRRMAWLNDRMDNDWLIQEISE